MQACEVTQFAKATSERIEMQTILLQLRSRLRDTDYERLSFNDTELGDVILQAQSKIIYELCTNIGHFRQELGERDSTLELEAPVLEIIHAKFNDKACDLKSYTQALKHPPKAPTLIALNPRAYTIAPFTSGVLEIWANTDTNEREVILDPLYHRALVLGALVIVLEIETNASNLDRVGFYTKLYEKECDKLRAILDPLYHRALVLGALVIVLEIETNASNLDRVGFYTKLYEKECDKLRAITNASREKRAFITPFIKA